jgi:hypothetical protein
MTHKTPKTCSTNFSNTTLSLILKLNDFYGSTQALRRLIIQALHFLDHRIGLPISRASRDEATLQKQAEWARGSRIAAEVWVRLSYALIEPVRKTKLSPYFLNFLLFVLH